MTIKELQMATAGLGFEDSLDSSSRFISAANRALYAANRIRPKDVWQKISHNEDGHQKPAIMIDGEGYNSYSIYNTNFLCFCPSPVMKDGKFLTPEKDYIISGHNSMYFKTDNSGIYRIHYYCKPTPITDEDEDAVVDLDEDICQILPLLIASYVWLDDEEEKSALYRNLFYSEAAQIKAFRGSSNSDITRYSLDGGWDC